MHSISGINPPATVGAATASIHEEDKKPAAKYIPSNISLLIYNRGIAEFKAQNITENALLAAFKEAINTGWSDQSTGDIQTTAPNNEVQKADKDMEDRSCAKN